MTRIAFLGLGNMGAPMATRLVRAGHDLTVWNRTEGPAARLALDGASAAPSAQAAVSGQDVVISMLAGPTAVAEVFAPLSLDAKTTVIEMSTVGPAAVHSLRAQLPASVQLIDAPVLGGVAQASQGALHVFAGGDRRTVALHEELLGVFGTVEYCGHLGTAAAVKLLVNLANLTSIVALGEALQLAEVLDIDGNLAYAALSRTSLGGLAAALRGRIDDPDRPRLFNVGLAWQSLELIAEAGAVPDGVAAAARYQLENALSAGLGGQDITAAVSRIAQLR